MSSFFLALFSTLGPAQIIAILYFRILWNEKFHILIQITLKFIKNVALVQVVAWRPTYDKPLPEPIITMHGLWARNADAIKLQWA